MNLTEAEKKLYEKQLADLKAQRGGLGNRLAGIETIFDGRSRSMSNKEREELYEEEEEIEAKIRELDKEIERLEKLLNIEYKPFRR